MSETVFESIFGSMYDTDRESRIFGDAFCGPERLEAWEWTLVAKYPKDPEDGDGQDVEVYVSAGPARFFKIVALEGLNSIGGNLQGFSLATGSGCGEWAANTAKMISEGMLGLPAEEG